MINPFELAGIVFGRTAGPQALARRTAIRLQRLVAHAAARVPYYRELFKKAGIAPQDICGPEDLHKIPLTSREDVQSRPIEQFLAEGTDPASLIDFATSGATGKPLTIRQSAWDAAINQALLLRTLVGYGMKPWHSKMSITGKDKLPADDSWHGRIGIYRRLYLSARWSPDRWVTELQQRKPDYLFGYCMTLRLIARSLKERAITTVRPRVIVTTSGVLDSNTRKEIADAFQCPVHDLYASWEGGILAWECDACGGYHVNSDWAVLEVLNDGRPAKPGEEGEVVITNLHSMGMPFVRYRQGDMVVREERQPSCGCHLPLVRSICGRRPDMIVLPSGRLASPHAFMVMLDHVKGIQQWRLTQREKAHFRLDVMASPEFGADSEVTVRNGLFNLVGRPVAVDIVRVESLPATDSGKFRYVISEVSV